MPQFKLSEITNPFWATNDGFKGGRDEEELTPLAERYDYAYHFRDIKKLIVIMKNNK